MSDLSWNPLSWTPSNLAEGLSDAMGLPEVVGDLVGGGVSLLTGDFAGAFDQGIDFAENVFSAISWDNDKVLHGPGGAPSPDCCKCPEGMYPPGEASDSQDIGPFQQLGAAMDEALGLGGSSGDDFQLGGGGLQITGKESVEELILKILAHLKKEAKGDIEKLGKGLANISQQERAGNKGGTMEFQGESIGKEEIQSKLQVATNEFGELSKLLANTIQLFHDAKNASIDKIGR
jgi:hypothetical protein